MVSSPFSAILSCTTSPRDFGGILRFDFFPEGFMGNSASLSKSAPGRFQNRLQLWRMTQEQAFQVLLARGAEQHRDRLAIACHHDGSRLGGLHILREIG